MSLLVFNCCFLPATDTSFLFSFKAVEAFDAIAWRLKDSTAEFEKAKSESSLAASQFNKVKELRTARFQEAFQVIDESLKTIYRDLTKSSKHP